jgi:hypothetical protein
MWSGIGYILTDVSNMLTVSVIALITEAINSPETSVNLYQTAE